MVLEKIKQFIIDGNQQAAEEALQEYIKPLIDTLKSCSIFERNESVRGIINQTIKTYDSTWNN